MNIFSSSEKGSPFSHYVFLKVQLVILEGIAGKEVKRITSQGQTCDKVVSSWILENTLLGVSL